MGGVVVAVLVGVGAGVVVLVVVVGAAVTCPLALSVASYVGPRPSKSCTQDSTHTECQSPCPPQPTETDDKVLTTYVDASLVVRVRCWWF